MTETPADYEFSTWEVPGHPLRVQYSLSVLEQVRRAVLDGFYSLPRGGVEVGGVLYGTHENGLVRISAFRPLPCEHALGPTFVLSENDEAALADLLAGPRIGRGLEGLVPVGWYHSHTRSDVSLTQEDLALYDRYFPEPWQVALVLRPYRQDHTRAGFFLRESDGSIRSHSSYREFTLSPPSRKAQVQAPPGSSLNGPRGPAGKPGGGREPAPAEGKAPAARVTAKPATLPAAQAAPQPVPPAPWPQVQPGPHANESMIVSVPPSHPVRRRRRFHWAWLAWAVFVAMVGVALAARTYWGLGAVVPVNLRALDVNGQLVISWDRVRPVLQARKGALDVMDGTRKVHFELDPERLRSGSFTYTRRSERVDLRMTIFRDRLKPIEEVLTFLGHPAPLHQSAVPADAAEAIRRRDEALREAEALRKALQAQNARVDELERAIKALRQRLELESGRR